MNVHPQLPFPLAVLASLVAGLLVAGSFSPLAWWPLAPVGVLLLLVALRRRGFFTGFLIAWVAGLTLWCLLTTWLTLNLGYAPWIAVSLLESTFSGIAGGLIALVFRFAPQVWTNNAQLVFVPLIVAGLWTTMELVAGAWPYGGFSWGSLGFSQSEGGIAHVLSWVGASGASFLMVWFATFCVQLFAEPRTRTVLPRVAIATALALAIISVPLWPNAIIGSTRVAAVQGNSIGDPFNGYRPGQNLADHRDVTEEVYGHAVDMVVWPENASDKDPFHSTATARTLDNVSRKAHAPLVVGSLTYPSDGKTYNSSLVWEAGKGVVAMYDKTHTVPFGEYIPDRTFFQALAPGLVGLLPHDLASGNRPNVLPVGSVRVGAVICFEIADDQLVAQAVAQGAELILAQSNNSFFGTSFQSAQQLAIARTRAIETGRTVVNISTVGTSAIVAPDGSTIDQLTPYTQGVMIDNVPLSSTVTPAMALSGSFRTLFVSLGVGGFIVMAIIVVVSRRSRAER